MSVEIDAQLTNQSGIGISGEAILVKYSASGANASTTITTDPSGFASGIVTVTPNTPYNFVGVFSGDAQNAGSTAIVSGFSLIVSNSGSTPMTHTAFLDTQLTGPNASGVVVGLAGQSITLSYTSWSGATGQVATATTDAGGFASGNIALVGGTYNFQGVYAGVSGQTDPANAFYSGLVVTNTTALAFTKVTLV